MASHGEGQINSARLIIPGLAGLYESIAPYSYALVRFIAGAILILHGYNKLFVTGVQGVADHVVTVLGLPMPLAWAYFIGILECFGGAALADRLPDPADRVPADDRIHRHHVLALRQRLHVSAARTAAMNIRCCCWSFTSRSSSAAPAAARSTA